MSNFARFAAIAVVGLGLEIHDGNSCKSVELPQYQAATLQVGHKTCHFVLDNSDGTLHVALGASGEHCEGPTVQPYLWEEDDEPRVEP